METHKIHCKEVMSHICDNIGEESDSPRCKEIKAHLEKCECCQKYFKSIDSTIKFYKEYNIEINEDMHNRLMDFLDKHECDRQ